MSDEYKAVGPTLAQMNANNAAQFATHDASATPGATPEVEEEDAAPALVGPQMHKTLKGSGFKKHEVGEHRVSYRKGEHEIRVERPSATSPPSWEHRVRSSNTPFRGAGNGHENLHKYLSKISGI